ncbi:MAG: hypothetical protein GOMPHAMPRED_001559 [Gomphillus americanus]|uniref:Uncharacterized protein n=1 Tax=Gomphillus americanus TaxID=1940652 RepID=A0A8H3F5K2_9LECA|nr:MAG: hypothetical protein GOMPHAMPRED_001559 [Gomphillus americanus]
MDKNRRQRYANHIRTLWLHSKHEVDDLEFGWEGRFHAKLTSLSFPILRDLSISTYPWSEEDHYAPIRNPIPYSQPLMKTLRILDLQGPGGVVICDEFLLALSSQSKNLEKLDVCIFLILSPPLSKLWPEPIESMSSEAFLNLSRMPLLLELEIPVIQGVWTEGLELGAFTALQNLDCQIDSCGLERILNLVPRLHKLSIRAMAKATDILSIIARAKLVWLAELKVTPCARTKISVHDLFSIADNVADMKYFHIRPVYTRDVDQAVIDGLDDTKLLALAQRLPKLRAFRLLFGGSILTDRSLISLVTQCPELDFCWLSATVDYQKLIKEAPLGTFTNLENLKIWEPDGNGAKKIEINDLQSMVKALTKLMPKLAFPDFPAHPDLSLSLEEAVSGRRSFDGEV